MQTQKYRIYIQTTRGGFAMGASDTVNDLVAIVIDWLENTSAGRSVTDIFDKFGNLEYSDVKSVVLYELDPKTGAYIFSKQLPATDRKDVIRKTRQLGGR